ncbi:MAG: hypothetical protein K0R90_1618, partial [Oscillospiraceae bacterium]|nr:hypothetical protein [Oscillospiraceae bacterium]
KLIQQLADKACDVDSGTQILKNSTPLMKIINKLKESDN